MEKLSIFFTCIIIAAFAELIKAKVENFSKVENIFQQNVTFKAGDIMQCEITKTNIEVDEIINDYQLNTVEGVDGSSVTYQPVSGKCFSFKVKALQNVLISLTSIPYYVDTVDVYLEEDKIYQTIRQSFVGVVKRLKKPGFTTEKEYRGFWIRWLDDELLEVGHENETDPFLYHRFAKKLQINFVGIMTSRVSGAWIINGHPKCPSTNGTQIQKKMKAESDCFILH